MRSFAVAIVAFAFSAMAFGQAGVRGVPGYCPYGCGPYIPLITTPSISLQTVSSSPVGATNATAGLLAGARNSTLSMIPGDTDASRTVPVWYAGGDMPIVPPSGPLSHFGAMGMHEEHGEHAEHAQVEFPRGSWTYYSGRMSRETPVEASSAAKSGKHAARTYTNDDVARVAAKCEPFRKH
jgi:hypothetical protein